MSQPLHYYKDLFDLMNQGFCIIELKFSLDGQATDYRFLETNPVFEKQTGLKDAKGKWMRELQPEHEEHWFELYGQVAKTREPMHFEREAAHLAGGVWYEVYAFPYGEPEQQQVSLLFNDITERKQTEQALLRSEKRLHSIANLVPDLLWDSEPDGSTNWYNARWLEYTGQSFEEAIGWGWVDAIHPDDRAGSAHRYAKAVAEGKQLQQEHRIRRYDGIYRWFVVRASPFTDENGQVIKMYGSATDIHDRRTAEEALRESEATLTAAFASVPVGIGVVDRAGLIIIANDNYRSFLPSGKIPSRDEANMMRWQAWDKQGHLISPQDFPTVRALRGESVIPGQEMLYTDEDGREIWTAVSTAPTYKGQGEIIGAVSVISNIDALKRSTAALREAELQYVARLEQEVDNRTVALRQNQELLQATLDSNPEMIQVFEAVRDRSGQIIDFIWVLNNHASEQIYGDVIGKSLLEFNPGVKAEGIFDAFAAVTETGIPQQYEKHYVHEQFDGWFYQSVIKLNDGVATTTVNITGRKQAELQLTANRDQLQSILDTTLVQMSILQAVRDDQDRITDLEIKAVNRELEKETGRNDLVGKWYAKEYPGIRKTGLFDLIVKTIETGLSQSTEYFYPYEGFQKWFTCAFVKLGDGVVATNIDISDRKMAEQRLRETEEAQQLEIFRVTLRTQEEERRRISESLHNGLGQMLYGIKMSLTQLKAGKAAANPEQYELDREYTSQLLSDAIRDSRRISHELVPQVLEEFGLEAAIDEVCKQMQDGVKFDCKVDLNKANLDKYLQLAVFRTFQELMTNVVKHAGATQAHAEVRAVDGQLMIRVRDNGRGISADKAGKDGIGLASIRSKVGLLDGEFKVDSKQGQGTTVTIRLPYIY